MTVLALAVASGFLLAPAAANSALTAIQAQGPKRLEIAYEGIVPVPVIGRIKAAEATITADISTTSYSIDSRATAAGVVDWFVDYNLFIRSVGSVTPKGLKPSRYTSQNRDGKKDRKVIVDYTGSDVTTTATPRFGDMGNPAATLEQRLASMDPLSAIVHLSLAAEATPANPCGGPIRAFDGKQRYDLKLTFDKRVAYKSKAYTGSAIVCDMEYVELAGFKDKSDDQKVKEKGDMMWSKMTLAEIDGGAIRAPLKIEARSKKRGKMTVQATRITYGPVPRK